MTADPAITSFDPYDIRPAFWQRHPDYTAAITVFILTTILTVVMFPWTAIAKYQAPEFAYAFAVPALVWAYRRPRLKLYCWTLFAAQAVSWTVILSWLHYVTWLGLFLLGPFVGAWIGLWYLAAWWAMPRFVGRATPIRLVAQMGLAGAWVVLEWTRSWFLGGFDWLPLSASQWQRTSILQIAAYTGAGGVSFVLMMTNIGFAAYGHRLFYEGRAGLGKRSQEFFLALFLLLACLCVQVQDTFHRKAFTQPLARVAFVQPDIPQQVKWDPARAPGIISVLRKLTLDAAGTHPDVILWPEAVTPFAVKGDPEMEQFVDALAHADHAPLLLGSVGVLPRDHWINGAFVVDPEFGVHHAFYAKQKLVAFGEYVPLRPILGWLGKFVPIGDDFTAGRDPSPLIVNLPSGPQAFGVLICYEDTYPQLARSEVLAGADLFAVLSNNAWFGRGAAAYQHAAHSVLRAVETRRPVLRCGNAGWSGWIDEFGSIRKVMTNQRGSIYFRGDQTASIERDGRWVGRRSFYVTYGDWFVLASIALAGFAVMLLRTAPSAASEQV